MNGDRTYVDYNASAPLRPEARAAVVAALELTGNPSSVHAEGRAARAVVDDAREQVARLVGARAEDVVFTSGATEANNSVFRRSWRTIIYAEVEHPSVRAPCLASEGRVVAIPVLGSGIVDATAAERIVEDADSTGALFVLQAANNETGVIQPVTRLAHGARARGFRVFSDAVQAAGRVPLDVDELGIDYLSLSAHKIGGPKGVGALVVRDRAADGPGLPPSILGGGQERKRRGGTENVAAIAGFGAAAAAALRDLADMPRLARLRDRLETEVRQLSPVAVVIGEGAPRLANTLCLALPGRMSAELVIQLDLEGIAASSGSACSSGKVGASHVLAAMGLAPDVVRGVVRVSIGHATSDRDIEEFLAAWAAITTGRARGSEADARPNTAAAAGRPPSHVSAGAR